MGSQENNEDDSENSKENDGAAELSHHDDE
jgi:hypothetical protein